MFNPNLPMKSGFEQIKNTIYQRFGDVYKNAFLDSNPIEIENPLTKSQISFLFIFLTGVSIFSTLLYFNYVANKLKIPEPILTLLQTTRLFFFIGLLIYFTKSFYSICYLFYWNSFLLFCVLLLLISLLCHLDHIYNNLYRIPSCICDEILEYGRLNPLKKDVYWTTCFFYLVSLLDIFFWGRMAVENDLNIFFEGCPLFLIYFNHLILLISAVKESMAFLFNDPSDIQSISFNNNAAPGKHFN